SFLQSAIHRQRRLDRDELQTHAAPRAIHRALELGVLGFDRKHHRVVIGDEDLADDRNRSKVRGRDDDAASLLGGAHEVLPPALADELAQALTWYARHLEDLEIVPRLLDEHAA